MLAGLLTITVHNISQQQRAPTSYLIINVVALFPDSILDISSHETSSEIFSSFSISFASFLVQPPPVEECTDNTVCLFIFSRDNFSRFSRGKPRSQNLILAKILCTKYKYLRTFMRVEPRKLIGACKCFFRGRSMRFRENLTKRK